MVSATNQLKLTAPDGKKRHTDVLDNSGVLSLAACFPNTKAARFVEWFTNSGETDDRRTKQIIDVLFCGSKIIIIFSVQSYIGKHYLCIKIIFIIGMKQLNSIGRTE